MKSITLPESISEIEANVFLGCDLLEDINVYSYKTFSKLDEDIKLIAIISTIKNYYTGKIKYSAKNTNSFKKYIRRKKLKIFEYAKENTKIINMILNEIGISFKEEDIHELLNEDYDTEIKAMLLEYSNRNFVNNIGEKKPLDEYDLGEFDDEPKDKEKKLKK